MLTIAPRFAVLIMAGMAYFDSRNMLSTLTCITRRYCSGFSSTTLPRLPMPTLLSRKSSRPQRSTADSTSRLHSVSLVTSQASAAALGLDHFDRALGKPEIEIGHHDLGAGARQQDCRCPAVADAIARGTPAADDGDPAGQAGIVLGTLHRVFS